MILDSKLIRNVLFAAVTVTAVKQIVLAQVIYALSLEKSSISSNTNADAVSLSAINILPTDEDAVRPYKWKEEEVTLEKYVQSNGKQMLEMEKEIADSSLTPDQKKRLEILGKLPHPCCNAPIDTKDCLHAQAAMGLAKYLITQGWDDKKIKEELFLWYRFWWPKHYAIAASYLQSKETNPQSVSVDDWMSERLSNIRSEQLMLQQ